MEDADYGRSHGSLASYLSEWDPIHYPGGLLSVLTFVQLLALLHAGTPFSALVLGASIPVMLYAARRILFSVALFVAFTGLYIGYWVSTAHRPGVLTEERFMVALNMLALYGCIASSAVYPHQYGRRDRPEHWRIELEQLSCAIPILGSGGGGAHAGVSSMAIPQA